MADGETRQVKLSRFCSGALGSGVSLTKLHVALIDLLEKAIVQPNLSSVHPNPHLAVGLSCSGQILKRCHTSRWATETE